MYRWRLADEPYDPDRFGDFHDDRAQMADSQPRGGQDETHGVMPALGARGRNDEEREAA